MISFRTFILESDQFRNSLEGYIRSDFRGAHAAGLRRDFNIYAKEYPFTGGKLYRGLNFSKPSEYLSFMRSVRNGFYTDANISSWGKSYSDGSEYAVSPKVFQLNSFVAATYDSQERVSGFIGVVVEIDVKSGIGIDANKSPYGLENEVILPPGSYKVVEVHTEKKWKHLLKNADINQEFLDIVEKRSNNSKDWDRIRALFRYKREDLLPQVIDNVMNRALEGVTKHIDVSVVKKDPDDKWVMEREVARVVKAFGGSMYQAEIDYGMGLAGYFNAEEVQQYIKRNPQKFASERKKIINKINKIFAPYTNQKVFFNFGSKYQWMGLAESLDIGINDIPNVKKIVWNTYNLLNTEGVKLVNAGKVNIRDYTAALKYVLSGPL